LICYCWLQHFNTLCIMVHLQFSIIWLHARILQS